MNLGGILAYWPDVRTLNEEHSLTNSPVFLTQVAYSETTWTGIKENKPAYWTSFPAKGTEEFKQYVDFEKRLVEHRDRFLRKVPFFFVKTTQIPWKILGTMPYSDAAKIEKDVLKNKKKLSAGSNSYTWSKENYHGGTIHIKHFFGFKTPFAIGKGHDTAYVQTYVYSPKNQEVDAWINFNTTSTSDTRSGKTVTGQWNQQKSCNIWINGKAIAPPAWQNPGQSGKEIPFTDDVYTSRPPTKIQLKKGWNRVVLRTGPTWKWCFTFTPIKWNGTIAREVKGLKFSAEPKR